jgi:predicted  nucleic acid-binding Zn-ribbon protein
MKKGEDIQSFALEIEQKEQRVEDIQKEFDKLIQQSNLFAEYQELTKQLQDFRKQFDKSAIKFLKKTNQKTSEGPAGKITLAERNSYVVQDENELPYDFKELPGLEKKVKSLKQQIKTSFELFKQPIPGIEQKKTEYIVWTKKKD